MARESVLVVGAGGISNAWLPPLLAEKLRIVGLVDLDAGRARAQAKKYEIDPLISTDLKAALRRTTPDLVVDLTVPEAHCKVTLAALKAGCHVVGEKPMASSMTEARRMVHAAEAAGRLYAVSQNRRFNDRHESLRRTLAKGKVGDLTTINCDFYIGAHFGGFRAEMESPLILDMAIHHFDLARFLTGVDPVAVYCHEFNPKGSWYAGDVAASCIFEMTDGVVFTYRGSWCSEGCNTDWNGHWRLIGDSGTLLYDKDGIRGEAVKAGKREGLFQPMKPVKPAAAKLRYAGQHGALREVLKSIRGGPAPQCECHDNIKSLAMVFAAVESARRGQRVKVKAL